MATKKLTLELTEEQKQAILQFININDWNVGIEEERAEEVSDASIAENDHFPIQRYMAGEEECPDCFCAPCMVHENKRQMWWPDKNSEPKCANATQRKRLYQRFWSVMQNCGAWKDESYLRKKVQAGGKKHFAWHRRELMPDCILRQCREWLPNPEKVPYMGHKWQ